MTTNDMQACKQYWTRADYLPLESIIDYWCGDKNPYECRTAKKWAIITACEKKEIGYERTLPWNAPVFELAEKGLIMIKRESFETWVQQFPDGEDAIPKQGTPKREQTLLKIIGALLRIHYDTAAYKNGEKHNAQAIEKYILSKLKSINGLKEGTIRKDIPKAIAAIEENFDNNELPWEKKS